MKLIGPVCVVAAILLAGCNPPPAGPIVYVDIERVLQSERAPELAMPAMPNPPKPAASVLVKQPGLPATNTSDKTLQRLQQAKKLIEANRGKSIAALSSLLKRIYLAKAEDDITKLNREALPESDSILKSALEKVREAFDRYGQERGPLIAKLNVLVGNTDLQDQELPENPDPITKYRMTEANKIRAQLRDIDGRYDAEADKLMAEAQAQIQAQIAEIQRQAHQIRAVAESKAVQEAEQKATQTQTMLDVQITQLVPEKLPAVPSRQVVVPGTKPVPPVPADKSRPIFGSLAERRHLLDQAIDVWVRSTGRRRSYSAGGGTDATEEFMQWRSAHKAGP